jgi:methylase of polypeptide subunit release factors
VDADSAAPAVGTDVSMQALAAARKAATRARVTVTRARVPGAAC